MTLNIFAHPVENETIHKASLTWAWAFDVIEIEAKVWIDGNNTSGLADGYIKAIERTENDYIFMLEHDWEFIRKPEHSLEEITELMKRDGITHLRFNKRKNEPKLYDKYLTEKEWYCETPFVSNNPHIIDRKAYLEYIEKGWIQRKSGSLGVEEIISQHINGAVYGKLGHPQMVKHLNGR